MAELELLQILQVSSYRTIYYAAVSYEEEITHKECELGALRAI
jgi:hypothetical protein